MNPKIYVKYLLIVLSIFVGYHFTMWHLYTSKIFKPQEGTSVGDLGRMSYQISLLHNRELKYTLEKKHFYKDNFKNQKITVSNINNVTVEDMVTIFDGFVEEKVYIEMYSSTYNETVLCTKKELKYMLDKYNAWCKYKGIYSECNTVDEMIDEPYFDIVLYHYREII